MQQCKLIIFSNFYCVLSCCLNIFSCQICFFVCIYYSPCIYVFFFIYMKLYCIIFQLLFRKKMFMLMLIIRNRCFFKQTRVVIKAAVICRRSVAIEIYILALPSEKDCFAPEKNLELNSTCLKSSRNRGVWYKSLEENHSTRIKERSLLSHIMCSEETQKKILESDIFRIL